MLDGVVVLGIPEIVLLLVATCVSVVFLCIVVQSSGIKKWDGLEGLWYGVHGPAFIVDKGKIASANKVAKDSEMAERLQELAIEAAGDMVPGAEFDDTVIDGNKEFTVRGIRLSTSRALVLIDERLPRAGLEDLSYGVYGPAFIVDKGKIASANKVAKDSEMAERLQELAIEAAGNMVPGAEFDDTVIDGNKEFTVRGIRLSTSRYLVLFDERGYFADILMGMAHEINTPLASVLGLSGVVVDEAANQARVERDGIQGYLDRVRDFARKIHNNGKILNKLFDQAIHLAKLRDPDLGTRADFEPLNMKPIIDECVRKKESEYGVRITRRLDDNLPIVYGDRDYLERVFDNLLENAVKYSGDKKAIAVELSCGEKTDHVTCRVTDNGVGIPTERVNDIFRQGVQLDPHKRGTGYGLSVVKSTVERLHKGKIEVDSTEDNGTSFIVHLPCAD